MEILSNFNSIYCFIAFIIGAVFVWSIFIIDVIIDIVKDRKLRNKVHFYVTCEKIYYRDETVYTLWIGKPYYTEHRCFRSNTWSSALAVNTSIAEYNLNLTDFADMKEGEIREVFINLED